MFCADSFLRSGFFLFSLLELGLAEEGEFMVELCYISTGSSSPFLANYHSMVIQEQRLDLDQCCPPGQAEIAIAADWIEMLLGKIR